MSDDGPIFVRVIKGEESLGTCIMFSGVILAGYVAYMNYVPKLSDFWLPYIQGGYMFVFTYAVVSAWNASHSVSIFPRLLAWMYVLLLVAAATWLAWGFYGVMGLFYPLLAGMSVFVFK